jgi:release factor glutamine methyltransferase
LLLLVHSEICGPRATVEALGTAGLEAEVVACERGLLGPLLRERRTALEAAGRLRPGQTEEDVMVLRARLVGRTSARWPIPTP